MHRTPENYATDPRGTSTGHAISIPCCYEARRCATVARLPLAHRSEHFRCLLAVPACRKGGAHAGGSGAGRQVLAMRRGLVMGAMSLSLPLPLPVWRCGLRDVLARPRRQLRLRLMALARRGYVPEIPLAPLWARLCVFRRLAACPSCWSRLVAALAGFCAAAAVRVLGSTWGA